MTLGLTTAASAAPWSFDAPLDVTTAHGEHVFHHLESAGRKTIAARGGMVAVAWEDNRDGTPRCYFASKAAEAEAFARELRLSGPDECYEPALAALDGERFIAVWEEGGRVRARIVAAGSASETIMLGLHDSAQASVGADGDVVYAAWAEKDGRFARITVARLVIDKSKLTVARRVFADSEPAKDDQAYPTLSPARSGAVAVAWEDRRNGHTFITQTFSADGVRFIPLKQVNETRNAAAPATSSRNRNLGRGPGAMRVALARQDDQRLVIVWLDKRDFLSGYDVYAAFSNDGGRSFGKNQKVQDSFGDNIAQWHPAVAAYGDQVIAVWDDDRDSTADLWLSWPEGAGWSDDMKFAGASGPGVQAHPSIALDDAGDVHVVWLDKADLDGTTRLRYARGRKQ
ncbi:MAG: hypothetical protein HY273_13330 [Gammaproteobacteria bacterium]|nr:hypothetical protein [Gammaproteobacteria bacterium]